MSGILKIKEEKVELSLTLPHARQLLTSLEDLHTKDVAILHFIEWLKRHTVSAKEKRDLHYEMLRSKKKKKIDL